MRRAFAIVTTLGLLGLLASLAACRTPPAPAPPEVAPNDASSTSVAPATSTAEATIDAPVYDLVLRGGRVLDPASGRDGAFDVAIAGGRVAKIAPVIEPGAARVLDVAGLLVVPGFVDLHAHVFAGPDADHFLAGSPIAARVDEVAPRSCTTTVVDAGSSGHASFDDFDRAVIRGAKTRVLAFLNIVGRGMRGGRFEQDLADMDARATADAIRAHDKTIVGVKVAHYAGPGWEPYERALEAARATETRVMIDFGGRVPELSLEELLARRLAPGDVFTHAFAKVPGRTAIVDDAGAVRPYVLAARERGVVFDVGYGGKSFRFDVAGPAARAGFFPDTISTDMHRSSLRGSMHDVLEVASKLGALGMPLAAIVRALTLRPADVVGRRDLGRLEEGAEADIAVIRVEHGSFRFRDVAHSEVRGESRLDCVLTLRAGAVLWEATTPAR